MYVSSVAIRFQAADYFLTGRRVREISCPNLHGRSPDNQVFQNIFNPLDPAQAYNLYFYGSGGLIHPTERDGADCRARKAARNTSPPLVSGPRIDSHSFVGGSYRELIRP